MDSQQQNDPLGPFEVTLFGKEYTLNPRVDLAIDDGDLGQELTKQPTMYAYYSVLADEAQNTVEAWQVKLQQKESELYDRFVKDGSVKQTEDPMKKAIRGHEEYHEIQHELVNSSMTAAKLRSLVNAFIDRRFCLSALQSRQSKEMFHEGGIMKSVSAPKPLAVAEHRTAGAFPGKKGK